MVINRKRRVAHISHQEIPKSNSVNIVFCFRTFFQMLSWSEDNSKALVRFFGAAHQRYISVTFKALVNEDTLLRTPCCPWCFLGCANWETLLRTQNVSEQNQKHFLCPEHKTCVRNKCCAREQTGKHLCRQQCVLVCQSLNKSVFLAKRLSLIVNCYITHLAKIRNLQMLLFSKPLLLEWDLNNPALKWNNAEITVCMWSFHRQKLTLQITNVKIARLF